MVLEAAFLEKCRQAFQALDSGHRGALGRDEMRNLLETILEKPPSDDIFFRLMAEIEEDCGGQIVDAWIALGGGRDKSGQLDKNKLIQIVSEDFQMTIDIGQLLDHLDLNKDGRIDYKEFAELFK
ncbi:EF hand domain-containing protein [Toxoplasma gondii TgCatPRC2]|uniref:EF hand domain-containing protein n=15 Tax=Toxoplasma gondii TaxID=5811 RepID=B9PZD1_TOXGV|nr:EF hand domain-containing protein [Toxoplasma gondii ME49]EPR57396.1 EF hand domain-containing protein [Toxoplasma gondii GT1]ESS29087.1 EF hand domain-containing protein [Toxoplasma gondii VEG]KAF4644745.1 EF hand domain-containing protein [Toxoplasma gondii]KFG30365.1 EF hand domain-containing protein [Toxoplasma gondii p89]KFG33425.1 EF hand domain-containing protein [Toxoplasma gondii GAB2-2007-GAL-DOM2]KFG45090.1 EF hand domain-containing protein [Toxoplasma gondii FOU]KFG59299.1 EF |eukprot:XP_002370355.1 EF hand domain-containing protein [Toxoplasma gondii ME49]